MADTEFDKQILYRVIKSSCTNLVFKNTPETANQFTTKLQKNINSGRYLQGYENKSLINVLTAYNNNLETQP